MTYNHPLHPTFLKINHDGTPFLPYELYIFLNIKHNLQAIFDNYEQIHKKNISKFTSIYHRQQITGSSP